MRGEFVDVEGARLYYYAAGDRGGGEPIVLLHGFPTSSHLWSGVVPLLPSGHRVVVVDLLGYGRSDRPEGRDVSLRGHAERIAMLFDMLGINYACVAGHDIGGGIAQVLATRWPARVSRLCLVNAVAFDSWPTREVKLARAMLPLTRHLPATWLISALRRDLLRGYADAERGSHSIERYTRGFSGPEGRDALVEHLSTLEPSETAALADRLRSLPCPSAIVWGAHDPFLPVAIGQRLHELLPRSTLRIVPESRHFTPEESPETVAAAITALLAAE